MREYSHNPLISADSANQGNHLNGLTTRQDRALMALLESPSIAAAARKAEVGESTLRQWLREDEDFQAMLRLIRHETLSHVTTRLQQEAEKALDKASKMLAAGFRCVYSPYCSSPPLCSERREPRIVTCPTTACRVRRSRPRACAWGSVQQSYFSTATSTVLLRRPSPNSKVIGVLGFVVRLPGKATLI